MGEQADGQIGLFRFSDNLASLDINTKELTENIVAHPEWWVEIVWPGIIDAIFDASEQLAFSGVKGNAGLALDLMAWIHGAETRAVEWEGRGER